MGKKLDQGVDRPVNQISVLLVEDNACDAEMIQKKLSGAFGGPYDVCHVMRLDDALQKISQATFDVVLLDLRLPDSEGLETIQKIRADAPDLPIVVLSGLDDDKLALNAVRQGAQDYIVKGKNGVKIGTTILYSIERKSSELFKQQLMNANRMATIGQLAAGTAHEVNNSVAFILINSETTKEHLAGLEASCSLLQDRVESKFGRKGRALIDDLLSERNVVSNLKAMKEMLEDNVNGMRRIQRIVQEMRVFSRIERDEVQLIQINDVVNTVCTMVRNQINHRAKLVKDLGEVPPIAADLGKLSQAVLNVVINATHAIEEGVPDKNEIKIKTRIVDDNIVLTIEDTGCGISKDDQERIFNPFFTTKPKELGAGLGLSLCAETLHKHRGQISVQSEAGKGACFTISIPLDTGLAVASKSKEADKAQKQRQRARILLIDDDSMVRRGFYRLLMRFHDVVEASGGEEALNLLDQDSRFDVVICDMIMPEMDGPAIYEAVRSKLPHIAERMVFITGGAFTERARDFALNIGAIILDKPVPVELLLDTVDRFVSSSRYIVDLRKTS